MGKQTLILKSVLVLFFLLQADNGVILVIDGVLLPEAEAAPGEELAAPLAEIMIPPMDEIMAPMAELMAPTSE